MSRQIAADTLRMWDIRNGDAMSISTRMQHVNGTVLHVVEAGPADGPLIILLHGFPDFWWGWRHQIAPLAQQGFRVVVPDQRGYDLSAKPYKLDDYRLELLSADVVGLADTYERSTFRLVGHDWGGIVAWETAIRYPQRIVDLVIMNAPHPDVWLPMARNHLRQAMKSYYALFFQLPWLPEMVLRTGNWWLMRQFLTRSAHPQTFTFADVTHYVEAWEQPGAFTAMLNYYRAMRRKPGGPLRRVSPPTLVIWGTQDVFLERRVAEAGLALCDHGQSRFLNQATHWVQLEAVEQVNAALADFFASPDDHERVP